MKKSERARVTRSDIVFSRLPEMLEQSVLLRAAQSISRRAGEALGFLPRGDPAAEGAAPSVDPAAGDSSATEKTIVPAEAGEGCSREKESDALLTAADAALAQKPGENALFAAHGSSFSYSPSEDENALPGEGEGEEDAGEVIAREETSAGGTLWRRAQRRLSLECERSAILSFFRDMGRYALLARCRTLGIFLFTFGVWTLGIGVALPLVREGQTLSFGRVWFGIAAILLALPFLFSKKTSVGGALCRSRAAHFLLFDLLALPEDILHGEEPPREGGILSSLLLGTLFGALTILLPPARLLAILVGALAALATLLSPETGLLLLILALPFASPAALYGGILACSLSFFLKLLRGKRSVSGGPFAFLLAVLAVFSLFGTIFPASVTASPREGAGRLLALLAGFLAMQLLRDSKNARRLGGVLTLSSLAAAAVGLLSAFASGGAASLPCLSPSLLGCYFALCLPYLPAYIGGGRGVGKGIALALCLAAVGACLLMTRSLPALLLGLLALLLYFIIHKNPRRLWFLPVLLAVSGAILAGSGVLGRVPALSQFFISLPNSTTFTVTRARLRAIFSGNPLIGAGCGVSAPLAPYLPFADPTDPAPLPAGSLATEILAEGGVIGALLYALLIAFLFFEARFARHTVNLEDTDGERMISAGDASLTALLVGSLLLNPLASPAMSILLFVLLSSLDALSRSSAADSAPPPASATQADAALVYRK